MFEELVNILCEQLPLKPEDINADSRIKEDLGADSLDVLQLLMALEEEKGSEGAILDIMELWARDLMAVQSGASPYQASHAQRLGRCGIDGRALLKGVLTARQQLASNVSWPNALENMYFQLIETGNSGRTRLSWQR